MAEGRGAKRWPEEDHRFLSLPHAKKEPPLPPRAPESLFEASVVCQGHEAAISDHHVVDNGNPHRTTHRTELLRDGAIFGRWGRISGGMIVHQDDGRRTLGDGGAKHFARVDQGGIQDAPCNEDLPDHAVAGRQKESVKFFLKLPRSGGHLIS